MSRISSAVTRLSYVGRRRRSRTTELHSVVGRTRYIFWRTAALILAALLISVYLSPSHVQIGTTGREADTVARINVGSSTTYVDASRRTWAADTGYRGGSAWAPSRAPVHRTRDDRLYQKHRWGMSAYSVQVPSAGVYTVRLHFAEMVFSARGKRVFDVLAESALKIDNLDVAASAGVRAAYVREFAVSVRDGALDLRFRAVVEDPMLSGLEVLSGRPASISSKPSPSPTTAPTPTPSPTAKPSASPTTKPSSSPTVGPTSSPSATPSSKAPSPSSTTTNQPTSGWPNASNTGVPPGTTLKPSGSITITKAGTVVEGLDVSGVITVRADNVTIRKTRVRGGRIDAGYGDYSGLLVEDVEIDGLKRDAYSSGIGDSGFTCRRCHIHGVGHGVHMYNNVVIVDSYIHDIYWSGDSHNEPIISNGGSNFVIRRNNLEMADVPGGSAALALYGDFAPIRNALVENNLFNGGGFCVYGGSVSGKPHPVATNTRFLNNAFGRKVHPKCGYYGPVSAWNPSGAGNVWSGNYWVDTKEPV